MPELADVMRRLDGMEGKIDRIGDLIVKLAEQQKDIDFLRCGLNQLRKEVAEDYETRLQVLERVHAGCQIQQVDASLKKMWGYFWGIVTAFIGACVTWLFWGGKQ